MSTVRRTSIVGPGRRAKSKSKDREVGYGKPPRAHQFKPGQSGNRHGRPKGVKNEATILHDVLHRKIEIREAGRTRKITVLEAMLLRFTESALKGDTKSAAFVLNRYGTLISGEPPSEQVAEEDREILDDFVERWMADKPNKGSQP